MRRLVLATLAAAALAGPALAANEAPPTVAPKFESVPQDAVLSYNLIGLNVTDAQNNTVGEIKDLVIDHDKLTGYIVSVGGFLGMGEKYHPIPWSSLKYDEREGGYVVNFSREMLEAAPADSIEALVAGNAVSYRDRTYDYYNAPRYW